jgi:hypothetical protein
VQLAGLAMLGVIAVTITAVSISGATAPSQGASGPYIVPVTPFTANTPFSSGQFVNVVVPANSLFVSTSSVNIVECAAPNGVLPTLPSECDGNTIQGETILPNTDGSINLQTQKYGLYQVFALPDSISLGESPSSAVTCGNTAATECVLYIGDAQGDFTQPHVFSEPFYIQANADDKGESPGDGSAPVVPTAPSATISTVTASPTKVAGDGTDQSTLTVTLLGTGNVPVPGKTVTLSQGTGQSTIIPAATPNVTDSNGVATFTVTDSHVETVTYTAEDTSDSPTVTVNATAMVDFETPVVNAANSSISSSLASVPSGQSDTISVTLRDQAANPQPVAGQTVTLTGTGSVAITPQPATGTTNSSGVATFTATDPDNEVVTFTATDTTASPNFTLTTTVTFGTLTVSAATSTVTASPVGEAGAANGGSQVTVTLLTTGGSPVSGITVELTASSKTATISTGSGSSATLGSTIATDAKGVAIFTVTDSAPETVTFTATDTTDSPNIPITATASTQFETPTVSAAKSTVAVTPAPPATVVADGATQASVSVVLKDQFGNAVSGASVTLQVTGTAPEVTPIPIGSTQGGTTAPTGEAAFDVDDEVAEAVTVTAVDTSTTPHLTVAQTATITFTPGAPDPGAESSTVVASPANPASDGRTPTTVTVTVTDEFGNPVSGQAITLAALPSGNTAVITAGDTTTNASGVATFTATDATAEVVTFQATDATNKAGPLASEGVVTFGNPPVPPPVAEFCSVVATPTTVPADGATSATISVLLYNGAGDAVPGKTVTLTPSGGNSTVTAVNATTTDTGNALFTVTDTTAESVTYTAEDTTDSVNLPLLPVTVQFTAAAGTTTTTSTTTTTTASTGSSTTTTSTTAPSSTTTTTSGSGVTTAAGDTSSDGSSGDSSGDGSGSSSLAFTGVSPLLFWFAGLGALMTGLGTLGRRRFKEAK